MKTMADRLRRDVQYEVGQLVYVRLRPYRQLSVREKAHTKLAKRYFGPFRVLERIGSVAYRLQLPPGSKIHPVFHCSLLKPHHGPLDLQTSPLPPDTFHNSPILEPLTILDWRVDTTTTPPTKSVLVQWLGLTPEDSSWEPWDTLCRDYHLEGKVIFPGDDIVSLNEKAPEPTTPSTRPRCCSTRPKHLRDFV